MHQHNVEGRSESQKISTALFHLFKISYKAKLKNI